MERWALMLSSTKKFQIVWKAWFVLGCPTTISLCSYGQICNKCTHETFIMKEWFNNGLKFYEIIFFATSMMGNLETWSSSP
jgi:hypothetical protein